MRDDFTSGQLNTLKFLEALRDWKPFWLFISYLPMIHFSTHTGIGIWHRRAVGNSINRYLQFYFLLTALCQFVRSNSSPKASSYEPDRNVEIDNNLQKQ